MSETKVVRVLYRSEFLDGPVERTYLVNGEKERLIKTEYLKKESK